MIKEAIKNDRLKVAIRDVFLMALSKKERKDAIEKVNVVTRIGESIKGNA
jgi:hypothetical protein